MIISTLPPSSGRKEQSLMLAGTMARQLPRVPKTALGVPKETQTCSFGHKKTSWFHFKVPGIMESPQRLELPPLPGDPALNLEILGQLGNYSLP